MLTQQSSFASIAAAPFLVPQVQSIEQVVVCVHMLPFFSAIRCGDCVENAGRELIAAVQADAPVYLLETAPTYMDDSITLGPGSITLPSLVKLLRGYDDWKSILWDKVAAGKVAQALAKRFLEPKVIRIFGVETDVCVFNNVKMFMGLFPNARIEVVKAACSAGLKTCDPWQEFASLAPQVVLE